MIIPAVPFETAASGPAWQRPQAFPVSPEGWGWLDPKGRRHSCPSKDSLLAAIQGDRDAAVILVWTPIHPRMILPEELDGAAEVLISSRQRRAADDLLDAKDKLRWFGWMLGGLGLYLFYQGWAGAPRVAEAWERMEYGLRVVVGSVSMGITLLMLLIFAFIPWYQSRKRLIELRHWTQGELAAAVPILRFETWLDFQKAPVTRVLLGMMLLVGGAQLAPGSALESAGLYKDRYLAGESWRLFTAPFLHANLIHFLMNASALLYLGKRMEVFARWPHVPTVFLFAACVGGEASTRFVAAPSVGASGGLMGWLGFLLVFESLHGTLVPKTARRRLLGGVILTGVIGLIGYRYIDNAAHLGGLLAGMLYAAIVFPKSSASHRPECNWTDRIVGSVALTGCVACALLAVRHILF